MVTGTYDQGRGARVKQARVTPLRHFCVSGVIVFSNTTLKILFRYYFNKLYLWRVHKILE